MNIIRKIWIVKMRLKEIYKKSQFQKYANVGVETSFGQLARCMNQTGDKSRLQIGSHCDIDATLSVKGSGIITVGDYTTIRYESVVGGWIVS